MNNNHFIKVLLTVTLLICLIFPLRSVSAADDAILPTFSDFINLVSDGQANMVRGVYVPGILALPVFQQPEGEPGTVLSIDEVATQFSPAAQNNVIGLLAHNYLAGDSFYKLKIGQEVRIVYGDGRVDYFRVSQISAFQVIPNSRLGENFIDLSSNITYNTQDIFSMFYAGAAHVTFQTCILNDGNFSWGRFFVVAMPGMPKSYPKIKLLFQEQAVNLLR